MSTAKAQEMQAMVRAFHQNVRMWFGDPREAVRMLLGDLATMALDGDAASSRGYLRGRFSEGNRRPPWIEEV
jgi:hypothetical protein